MSITTYHMYVSKNYSIQIWFSPLIFYLSLRRGPGSNVQDSSGYSALHHAALNGHRYSLHSHPVAPCRLNLKFSLVLFPSQGNCGVAFRTRSFTQHCRQQGFISTTLSCLGWAQWYCSPSTHQWCSCHSNQFEGQIKPIHFSIFPLIFREKSYLICTSLRSTDTKDLSLWEKYLARIVFLCLCQRG